MMKKNNNNFMEKPWNLNQQPVAEPRSREPEVAAIKEPFIPFPRYLTEHLRNHLITYRELELYSWMRLHANMYGISSVNVRGIIDDLPHFRSVDNVTKILRSLRSKKYIYYLDRQGHRGSFGVHFGDWLLEGGVVKSLDRFFKPKNIRGEDKLLAGSESEVNLSLPVQSPKLDRRELLEEASQYPRTGTTGIRSDKNDNDNEKEKENYEVSIPLNEVKTMKKVVTRDFVPSTREEKRCKDIAEEVGDPYINYVISVLQNKENGGVIVLEKALVEYRKAKQDYEFKGKQIDSPAALFNYFVRNAMESKSHPKKVPSNSKYAGL